MALRKKTKAVIGAAAALAVLAGGISTFALTTGGDGGGQGAAAEASTNQKFTLSADQDRVSLDAVPEAVAALKSSGFSPIEKGKLTVVTNPFAAPLSLYADDDTTLIGNETDLASLIADGLGLELNLQAAAWADWPLGIQSGKYDLILSNVTVTDERKEIYDFASYRQDLLGFYVNSDSAIDTIAEAKDVAGLRVIVGSGTNQEKILQAWDAENIAAGLDPVEYLYFDDTASASLALKSGRADANFGPNATSAYSAALDGETRVVGTVDGGWPKSAPIAAATAKDNGLIDAVGIALNAAIEGGEYAEVLGRWGLESESLEQSEINPPGLPKTAE